MLLWIMRILIFFIFLLLTVNSIPNNLKAQTLYRYELGDNNIMRPGGKAYRGGGETYYTVPENDLFRNKLYDSQIRDSAGNIYNCDSFGNCR